MGPVPSVYGRACMRAGVSGQRGLGERAISWVRYASARHLCPSHPLRHGAWARAPTRQRRRLEETCRTGTSSAIPGTWGLFGAKATGSAPRRQPRPVHSCKCEDTPSAKRVALRRPPPRPCFPRRARRTLALRARRPRSPRPTRRRRRRRRRTGSRWRRAHTSRWQWRPVRTGAGGGEALFTAWEARSQRRRRRHRCGVAGGGGETADALGAARTAGRHQRVHVHGTEGACALGLARRSPEPHKSDGAAVGAGGGGAADSVDLLVDALVVPAAADRDCEHRKETADHAEHHQPDGGGELKVECADDAEGRVEDKKTDQEADEHEDVPPAFRRVRADELPHLAAEGGPVAVPHAEPSGSGPVAPLPASAGPAAGAVMLDGKAYPALGQRRP